MTKWVLLNQDFVDESAACLSFKDLAFLRGYGVFDFFRLAGTEPLFLDDHMDRFYASADGLHLAIPFKRVEMKQNIMELLIKNHQPNTGIRLSLTGGIADDGFSVVKPNFIISQHSITPPAVAQVEKGIKLLSHNYQRQLSAFKTIDYLTAIWLQPRLKERGFDDALYHNAGYITECPRSNFFLVTQEEVIVTPATGMLKGITRKKILELARQHFQVEERAVHLDEVKNATEAFTTSTTKQILPVTQVDDVILPGKKVATHLLNLFRSAHGF